MSSTSIAPEMDKEAQDLLEDIIFVQLKVVTDVTIARHLSKSTSEAHIVLKDFFNLHKNVVRAVYAVSGTMTRFGAECGGLVLATMQNLEEIKATFTKVDNVELFALHKDPIDQVSTILAYDTIEDEKFFRDDDKRAGIKAVSIRQFREEMETGHKTEVERQKAVLAGGYTKPGAATVKSEVKQERITMLNGQKNKLTNMFEKAYDREKSPKISPKKVRKSPFSSAEKKTAEESPVMKKRARRIIIDSEDEISPLKKTKTTELEANREKKAEKSSKREKKMVNPPIDDDLYEAESPEKSPPPKEPTPEKVEMKKTQKKSKVKKIEAEEENEDVPVRRSPRKLATVSAGPGKKKVWVDETYKDEDDFLVTKKVLKEIDVEETKQEKPLSPKKTNQAPAPKAAKRAALASQSKISSFFTKK